VNDRRLLYVTGLVRAIATGLIGVLLGFHLAEMRIDARAAGAIISAGLAGAAGATAIVTVAAAKLGHRWTLVALALLAGAGGVVLAVSSSATVVAGAAFIGMVNGMGRDRGGALVHDQSMLPATVPDRGRTSVLAVYHLLQDLGHALGGLLAGLPELLAPPGAPAGVASGRCGLTTLCRPVGGADPALPATLDRHRTAAKLERLRPVTREQAPPVEDLGPLRDRRGPLAVCHRR
jgi:MFS family permease